MRSRDLVAEVRVRDQARGSGFLIAPGVILTALHVILGPDPDVVPAEQFAEFRLYRDVEAFDREAGYDYRDSRFRERISRADKRLEWRRARLIYPLPDMERLPDLALLRIEGDVAAFPGLGARPAAEPTGRGCEVRAAGFPMFKTGKAGDKDVWNSHDLRGTAGGYRNRRGAVEVQIRSDTPRRSEDWRGLSGSALWRDEEGDEEEDGLPSFRRLLGVIDARDDRVHGNNIVSYWPLDNLSPHDPFWRLAQVDPPGVRAASGMAQLNEAIAQLDRKPAQNRFRKWLGERPSPARPLAVVVRGHAIDEPALYITRLADILASEAYDTHADNYRKPIQLECGPSEDDPQDRVYNLRQQWASAYLDRPPGIRADFDKIIADGLAAPDRSRLIVIEHRTARFDQSCRDTLDKLLTRIAELPRPDTSPLALVLIFLTGNEAGPEREAFLPRADFHGKDVELQAYLKGLPAAHPGFDWHQQSVPLGNPDLVPGDVDQWLQDLSRHAAYQIHPALENRLRRAVASHSQFSMRFARLSLGDVLAE